MNSREFGLVPVRTEEWFNLIFVNLDSDAPPLGECLGELPRQAEKFDLPGMKCNGKTYIDNYCNGATVSAQAPGAIGPGF